MNEILKEISIPIDKLLSDKDDNDNNINAIKDNDSKDDIYNIIAKE